MNARRTLVLVALLIPLLSAPAQSKPGGFKLSDAERADSDRKLTFIVCTLKQARPDLKFGSYGVMPGHEYDAAVDDRRFKQRANEWQESNERLRKGLALEVDTVFPSLYTYIANPSDWDRYAAANLREARKYGEPVIAFLWPRYHEDSKGGIALHHMPGKDWRRQIENCRKHADGVVIWDYAKDNES